MTSIRRAWTVLGAAVAGSFLILGFFGREVYRQAPPVPDRVVTASGRQLFSGDEILSGQEVWQSVGGQQVGSVWGHGAYQAPDWSADWLHREATALLDVRAQKGGAASFAALESSDPSVGVVLRDAFNNIATGYTGTIHFTSTDSEAVLPVNFTFLAADAGVHVFTNAFTLRTAGVQAITATDTLTSSINGSTNDITVNPAAASQLGFTQQPGNSVAGTTISPAVQATVRDAFGNTVDSSASITIALGANPGSATFSGTLTVNAVNGVATFNDLSLDKAGTGYTVRASSSGLANATSEPFNVTAAAPITLAFSQQPTNTAAGAAITPAVIVAVQDAFGNTVTTSTASITLAPGINPTGGTFSGTSALVAINGVATFSDLSIDRAGAGYTLIASSTGLSDATSSTFTVTPGAASSLAFTQQPSDAQAAIAISPTITVTVLDAFGNTVTGTTASITLAIGANPSNGTLSGTTTVTPVNGEARFSGVAIDRAGAGYTLAASSTGLSSATSTRFTISAGPAARVAFIQQPTNTVAGSSITPPGPAVVVIQVAKSRA